MMEFDYETVRSKRRKRLTITVERDRSVVIHAPDNSSDSDIQRAVLQKRQWILEKIRHPQKYRTQQHPPGKEVVNGESALYLGHEYPIELSSTGTDDIELTRTLRIPVSRAGPRKSLRNWYIARANELFSTRVTRHARELGVQHTGVKIVDDRFRWGACTPRKVVQLNWRLIKAPMAVLDYVVIHELAHLLEGNHTERFWNIVRAKCPGMEKSRTWLRENGQLLEQDI